jgi:hypothetical protein
MNCAASDFSTPITPELRLASVRETLSARQARRALFPMKILADPAWDILLVLYAAALQDELCSMDALSAAGHPAKEVLRWIDALVGEGLVTPVATEGLASFRLTISGVSRMECFFSSPIDTSHI